MTIILDSAIVTARSIVDGKINMLEGVRKLCEFHALLGFPQIEAFYVLKAIDSETDHFPLGPIRTKCSEKYLLAADEELRLYLSDQSKAIMEACGTIIYLYEGR